MIDPTANEKVAIEYGRDCGAEYLSEIGKTDFFELTEEQANIFCGAVIDGFREKLAILHARDSATLRKHSSDGFTPTVALKG